MRKLLPLFVTCLLFFAACKKDNSVANVTPVITPPLPAGTVTTFAGTGSVGNDNGAGSTATFDNPNGLAVGTNFYVAVADVENSLIRSINPSGLVSTMAGNGNDSLANGTGTAASFAYPTGIAVDANGNFFVADAGNDVIREITSAGVVSTVAGTGGVVGALNGTGSAAAFNFPVAVAVDANDNVYVCDQNNNLIRKITSAGVVTTLAGSGSAGYKDGTGTAASFNTPNGIAVDANGNVYVADMVNRLIREISPAGVVTTFAGVGGGFKAPAGVAVDASGNIYVADAGANVIDEVSPAGAITVLAGSGTAGFTNALGTAASFNYPTSVGVDPKGNVYVADRGNQAIRKISSGK